jgi:Fuc2NAc and GlcNAc transferase
MALALALLSGGGVVAATGFLDDRRELSPRIRLLAHTAAALIATAALGAVPGMPLRAGAVLAFGVLAVPLTLLATVWCVNLYNFMDGIDGIAAVEAICLAVGAWLAVEAAGSDVSAVLLLGLAAVAAGYLAWNWPPAKIFMGDVGSGYLGFVVAVLTLYTSSRGPLNAWTWLVLFAVFVVDATYTVIARFLHGAKLSQAHRSHAYQKAARRWGGHRPVTLAVAAVNVCWLWPLAVLVTLRPGWGAALSGLAVAPLLVIEVWLRAGTADSP